MKIKLVESFEGKRNFKPHTLRLLKLIGSDLVDDEMVESIEPITMNEDMNDGTVRNDSIIISLIDNSHLECVIENAIPGTCSFVGQYLDGDSAGTKYTFVYCDEAGSNFAATRFNTTPVDLPTEILEVDGEDKGSYMIFTDEEIRSLNNNVSEDLDVRRATNKLIDMMEEGVIDSVKLATNLLRWMSEDDVEDFAREYGYFNDEETLTEGNNVSSNLTPAIDSFLQDIAQIHGGIDYNDIIEFGKTVTPEDVKKLTNLRRRYRAEAEYGDDAILDPIVAKVVALVKPITSITEAVKEVDLILNDDEVIDLDEATGDITIYDDVIDYTPELPIVFKFAEDEDNLVHKYVMKEHDEEAGTIRLAYAGPDELRESLLLEAPKWLQNRRADKATQKALAMDNKPDAKNWTYIVDGKSMNYSQYKELDDATRANAIVLDKGFYIRRGTEDMSDRLVRYTKDNADTTGHEYSNKADRKAAAAEQKAADKAQRAQDKADAKEQKAAEKADAAAEKALDKINLRDYAFTLDGEAVSYGDYLAMKPEKKARVIAVNKKGEQLDPETLAEVTKRYEDRRAQGDADKVAAAEQAAKDKEAADLKKAEDDVAKATTDANKKTFNQVKNTLGNKADSRRTAIKPKGTLTFYPADKTGKAPDTTQQAITAKEYAKLPSDQKKKLVAVDSKGSQFTYQTLLNWQRQAKKLKMESMELDFASGDILDEEFMYEELFLDEEEILEEDIFTIPGDEVMAGWIDNMPEDQIDAEVSNFENIATKLGLTRPEDLVMVVDEDMYYDPANYHFNYVEKTPDGARKYEIEGITFFVQPNYNGGYYLYFTSEEAAKRYAKIIEDENNEW